MSVHFLVFVSACADNSEQRLPCYTPKTHGVLARYFLSQLSMERREMTEFPVTCLPVTCGTENGSQETGKLHLEDSLLHATNARNLCFACPTSSFTTLSAFHENNGGKQALPPAVLIATTNMKTVKSCGTQYNTH